MPKVPVETGLHGDADDGAFAHRRIVGTSDYILKFDAENYPGLSLNAFRCLEAARRAGHVTADVRLNVDSRMLSVRRFDGEDGDRLGFEDLASLNAKTAADKYAGSIETDLFKRVAEFSGDRRKANLEAHFRLCVTSFAIRNGDAHLKNFALLSEDAERGPFTLSPAYDFMTTTAWIRTDMMALIHPGSKRWPKLQAVLQLGERAKLSRQRAREIVAEVGEGVRTVMPDMLAAFGAHGQAVIGRSIATAWNEGLATSLGVDPAPLFRTRQAVPRRRCRRGLVAAGAVPVHQCR